MRHIGGVYTDALYKFTFYLLIYLLICYFKLDLFSNNTILSLTCGQYRDTQGLLRWA